MLKDVLVQWNGRSKAINMLDCRAGVLRGNCLITARDKLH